MDHVFRVDDVINRQMESVKLDLWKLQQQEQFDGSRGTHDSGNVGGHQLKRLGHRVEEMNKSLQHQQCALQELLGRLASLVQATVIVQQRCDDTDRRLREALNSSNVATQDNSDCSKASWHHLPPSMVPHVPVSDRSGNSEHRQEQTLKACQHLEATISAKMDNEEKTMRLFVEDHVLRVQEFAVALEGDVKQCNVRMEGMEEATETVTHVLQKTVQAVKALRKELTKEHWDISTGLFSKTKKNQDAELETLHEVDEQLMEAFESVEQMGAALESGRNSFGSRSSPQGDPFRMLQGSTSNAICRPT